MKRLLTYLGLLATLLAMPYYAKADTWAYYLHGSFDNWANEPSSDYKFGDTSSSSGNNTWGKTISGSTLLTNMSGTTAYFRVRIKYTGNSSSNYDLGATSGDNTVITLGSSCEINSTNGGNAIQINNVQANHNYRFTFVSYEGRNSGKITVTDEGAITPTEEAITLRTDAYKRPNNVDWIGIKYNEYDSDNDTYIWYLNAIDFTSASRFKLELNNNWYGNGETVGSTFVTLGTGEYNCIPTIPTTTGNQVVRLEAKKVSGSWQARIVAGDGAHQYYWVSPQITNGEMWPAFRMVPSRNRYWGGSSVIGDGLISTKYYTFTIKDDDLVTWRTKSAIASGTKIQWYILRDDGEVVYRPTEDLAAGYIPNNGDAYDSGHPTTGSLDSYVSYINFWNGSSYDGATAYKTTEAQYNTGSWAFNKGSAKAHTFNLNVDRGHVLYNYTTNGTDDTNGFKLAGNWTAGKEVTISLEDAKPMTKYWYKDGIGNTSYVAEADSIVYKVDVEKPSAGWGGLYLDVLPGSSSTDWNYATVIRPLITLNNNLDGRALHGALTTASSDQSLNPETSDSYLGYTFSFNATTMTYRLEFHMPDATLSPGDDGNNITFDDTWGETITVNYSEATTLAAAATKCYIGAGATSSFALDETTAKLKDSFSSFRLTYDGTAVYMDGTKVADGNTAYIKIRGEADNGDKGEIHTYQYTFTATMSFEPQGGFFINSAKIKIDGGTAPYRYEVWTYPTKTVYGETVLDLDHGTKITDGTFANTAFDANDKNYRISTPGFLKIIDANNVTQSYDVIDGGFDFTYSTSENYNAATNGADYQRVMPSDLTWRLSPTWNKTRDNGTNIGEWNYTGGKHWSGDNTVQYLHIFNNTAYQTVSNLDAGTYTVQAIVRGGAVPVYLDLNDANVASLNLTGDGDDAKTTINKFGRSEQLVEMSSDNEKRGWHKLEGTVTLATAGDLKIAVRTDPNGSIDLADVFLLKDANTAGHYWTTAPTSETYTECDMSNRTNYNAFSFFDRGANLNSIIKADQKTVIGMSEANEPYLTGAEKGARRHPCNVVTSSDGGTTWHTPMLALTDYATVIEGSEAKYGNDTKVSKHAYGTTFAYTADKFSYDRATSEKMMSTMLPFALSNDQVKSMLGNGVKTYTYTGVDKTNLKVTFNETTNDLAAHTPFFFLPSEGEAKSKMALDETVSVVATSATSSPSAPAQGLLGTYKHISNVGTTYKNQNFIPYFFQNGSFVWAEDGARAKPFRVIFLLNKGNEARMLNAIFIDDTITGIDGITENIQQNAPVYSIDGKLVSSDGDTSRLSKGVYVKAGKKFIIK